MSLTYIEPPKSKRLASEGLAEGAKFRFAMAGERVALLCFTTELDQQREQDMFRDAVHPSAKGNHVIAKLFAPAIESRSR